jgi:hypothetical protein
MGEAIFYLFLAGMAIKRVLFLIERIEIRHARENRRNHGS